MMLKKYILLFVCALGLLGGLQAQVEGVVKSEDGELLIGATVIWAGESTGTTTDINGFFTTTEKQDTSILEISYVGFETVQIEVYPHEKYLEIEISNITALDIVEVVERDRGNYVSTLETRNTEVITACELRKAPCCNLAESFETNAAVDVSYSNAILGTKEIEMLGLRGTYTQLMMENRPAYFGLGISSAMEYIPGTWLESIQISKGTSTVTNGPNSITGQINAEIVKPNKDNAFFVNVFGASTGRTEVNVHLNKPHNDRWSQGILLHGSLLDSEIDRNEDSFLDLPKKKVLNGLYRLFYRGNTWVGQFNVQAFTDTRKGGKFGDVENPFQMETTHNRIEGFGKLAYLGSSNVNENLALIANYTYHELDANYNTRLLDADQKSAYANFIYTNIIGTESHHITTGASITFDQYDMILEGDDLGYDEYMPGVYIEYNYSPLVGEERSWMDNVGVILGFRADYHSLFGMQYTPRVNVKYNFTDDNIIRFSAGSGFRSANPYVENLGIFASNRTINHQFDSRLEKGWNFGANYAHTYKIEGVTGNLAIDLFHTRFSDQLIIDLDRIYSEVSIYNLTGDSYSNSFLISNNLTLTKNFDLKLAYKFNDVQTTINNELRIKPLLAQHKGLVTVDFTSTNKKWLANLTTQIIGTKRMPSHIGVPDDLLGGHPDQTPSFALMNFQVTRLFDNFEIYAGIENLTNYTQENPIIAAEDPTSSFFNAGHIYAPILGIRGHVGFRYFIESQFRTSFISTSAQCGSCKSRLEALFNDLDAVKEVALDMSTMDLKVKYDKKEVSIDELRRMISNVGYQADDVLANPVAYESLPACCQLPE